MFDTFYLIFGSMFLVGVLWYGRLAQLYAKELSKYLQG
jgi:hypothetical protein